MEGTKPVVQADAASTGLEVRKKKLREQCGQFESVMVSYMMKTMRATVMYADKPDSARETWEDMFSQQISQEAGKGDTLGLGDMLYAHLEPLLEKQAQTGGKPLGDSSAAADINRRLSEVTGDSPAAENLSLKEVKPVSD